MFNKRKKSSWRSEKALLIPINIDIWTNIRGMPKIFEQLIKKLPMKKVSKLKEFFKICLALIHDKDVVAKLVALI